MVFWFLKRIKKLQPAQLFQAFIDQDPPAGPLFIHLAHTIFGAAAGAVQELFGAKGHGAQPTGELDHAITTQGAVLFDVRFGNGFTAENGVATRMDHAPVGGVDDRVNPLSAAQDQKAVGRGNRILLKSDKKLDGITQTAMDRLMSYPWPGNARELKSAFEFAFVSCPGGMIGADHLPPQIAAAAPSFSEERGIQNESLDDLKRRRLVEALNQANGNQSEAARVLGISRTSVWNQIKKYQVRL